MQALRPVEMGHKPVLRRLEFHVRRFNNLILNVLKIGALRLQVLDDFTGFAVDLHRCPPFSMGSFQTYTEIPYS